MALIKVNNRGQSSDFSTEVGATKNLIINGAMQVSQRGTDINDIANDSTYIMDRFLTRNYGGNGTYDYDYSTDVPTATFKNSLKLTCKSASTNTGTAGYTIEQRIEGYNIRQLRLGRSNAQPITVSFWVKSSVAGTYSTGLRTTSAEYSYVTEFALSANTWKYVTYTAPALTNSLSSLNEESGGAGLLVDLVGLGKQTNKETSTLNAWQSGNKVNSSNQVAWMDSVNATVYLTGVQLEVGEIATPFEHRSYGEELSLCQRYYQAGGRLIATGDGVCAYLQASSLLPVEMRADPTLVISDNAGNVGKVSGDGANNINAMSAGSTKKFVSVGANNVVIGTNVFMHGHFTVDAEL